MNIIYSIPFKGAKRMHAWLTRDKGYKVSKNRVERLYYKIMGLRAVMPGKHTSRRHKAHKIYPYLLRNLTVERANQVWATDITYIPLKKGYMYVVAIIDLHSRFVLNWSVLNSMAGLILSIPIKEASLQLMSSHRLY